MVFIFVHLGAGSYSPKKQKSYYELLDACITKGVQQYERTKHLEDAALLIMTLLEDSGLVNTGSGSALSSNLGIECDAIVIRSRDNAFGSVVAVPNTIHPSSIAFSLLESSSKGLQFGQLIRPCILVGSAAEDYAKDKGIFKSREINSAQRKRGERYLNILRTKQQEVGDTVGCIVMNDEDMVVAGSSGGNWMKSSGRGGLCSVPGAGVWCESDTGCVCSGYGECFMRSLFAKRCCDLKGDDAVIIELIQNALVKDMERMNITLKSLFGVALVNRSSSNLLVVHSSKHFGFGVYSDKGKYVTISEKAEDEEYSVYNMQV